MSIINELITDRTRADVSRIERLLSKGWDNMTEDERGYFLGLPGSYGVPLLSLDGHELYSLDGEQLQVLEQTVMAVKGAYNATDLNRVTEAVEYLASRISGYGNHIVIPKIEIPRGGALLPDGYTQIEYVEASGTQYIDTEFKPNQDTKVVMDVQSVGVNTNDTGQSFFGARTSNSNMFAAYWHRTNTAYYIFYNAGNATAASDRLTDRMTVSMDKNVLYVGDNVSVSRAYAAFDCEYNLFLFASNVSGTADYFGVNRVYSCKIFDAETPVRDYIPCINPDGECGLFDLVRNQFYGNAGSGVFTAGPSVDTPSDENKDPYLWYMDDIPTADSMRQYLDNVGLIRSAVSVLPGTPSVPDDMEDLTADEANSIEKILVDVDFLLNNMEAAWLYSGDIYSGEVI